MVFLGLLSVLYHQDHHHAMTAHHSSLISTSNEVSNTSLNNLNNNGNPQSVPILVSPGSTTTPW